MTDNDNSDLDIDIDVESHLCHKLRTQILTAVHTFHTQIHPCVHKINIGDRIQAGAQVKTESKKCAQAAALHAQSYCYLHSLPHCSGLSSTRTSH